MKIGNLDLGQRPVFLAPMEDVTDIGFRLLCRQMGAAMVYSEFVAADALVRMVNKSLKKLEVCDEERPVAIQIYGKEPEAMADAARIVVEQAHPDVLDLNFGCPVKKIAGKGAGCYYGGIVLRSGKRGFAVYREGKIVEQYSAVKCNICEKNSI